MKICLIQKKLMHRIVPVSYTHLRERGVKATFFLLGAEVEKYPDIVKQMYEDGHLIGNHSYEHVNLSTLSDAEAVSYTHLDVYKRQR